MTVRRRDSRLEVVNADGVLRVWRDVSSYRTASGEYVAISSEARVKGERLTMHLATSDRPIPVRVLDSRPTIVGGAVRHQLRLAVVDDDNATSMARTDDGSVEGE
jgi:hypothetical protein